MDGMTKISARVTEIREASYQEGYAAAVADFEKSLELPKPKPASKPRKLKTQKPKTTVVREATSDLMVKQDRVTLDEITKEASSRDDRVTKFDVGNALRAMAKSKQIRLIEAGVYTLPAPTNGAVVG